MILYLLLVYAFGNKFDKGCFALIEFVGVAVLILFRIIKVLLSLVDETTLIGAWMTDMMPNDTSDFAIIIYAL